MSLPSSSLQSSWALSNPRWDAQILFYPCVFLAAWDCVWVGELGRDPDYGVRNRKLIMRCSQEIRRDKC